MHATHLVADVFGALASVVLGQAIVTFGHVSGLDFQDQKMPTGRDDDKVLLTNALVLALHA